MWFSDPSNTINSGTKGLSLPAQRKDSLAPVTTLPVKEASRKPNQQPFPLNVKTETHRSRSATTQHAQWKRRTSFALGAVRQVVFGDPYMQVNLLRR